MNAPSSPLENSKAEPSWNDIHAISQRSLSRGAVSDGTIRALLNLLRLKLREAELMAGLELRANLKIVFLELNSLELALLTGEYKKLTFTDRIPGALIAAVRKAVTFSRELSLHILEATPAPKRLLRGKSHGIRGE